MQRNRRNFNQNSGRPQRFAQGNVLTLEQRMLVERQKEMLRMSSANQGVSSFSGQTQSVSSGFNQIPPLLPSLNSVLPSASLLPNLLAARNLLPAAASLMSKPVALPSGGPPPLLGPGPNRNSLYSVENRLGSKNFNAPADLRRKMLNDKRGGNFGLNSRDRPRQEPGFDGGASGFGNRSNGQEGRQGTSKSWGNRAGVKRPRESEGKSWGTSAPRALLPSPDISGRYDEQGKGDQYYDDSQGNRGAVSKGSEYFNRQKNWDGGPESYDEGENLGDGYPRHPGEGNWPKKQKTDRQDWATDPNYGEQGDNNYESGDYYEQTDRWNRDAKEREPLLGNKPYTVEEKIEGNVSDNRDGSWAEDAPYNQVEISNSANWSNKGVKNVSYPDNSAYPQDSSSGAERKQTNKQENSGADNEPYPPPTEPKGQKSFNRQNKRFRAKGKNNAKKPNLSGKEFWQSRKNQASDIKPLMSSNNFLYPDPGMGSASDIWSRLDTGSILPGSLMGLREDRGTVEDILLTPENVFGWEDGWEGLKSFPIMGTVNEPNLQLQMGYLDNQLKNLDNRMFLIDNLSGNQNQISSLQGGILANLANWQQCATQLNQATEINDLRNLLQNKVKTTVQQDPEDIDLGGWSENMVVVYPFLKNTRLAHKDIVELREILSERIHQLLNDNPDMVQPRFLGTGNVCNNWFMIDCSDRDSADWLLSWKPQLKTRATINLCIRRAVDASRVTHISIFLKGIKETVRDIELRLIHQNEHLEPRMWKRGPHNTASNGVTVSFLIDAACLRLLEANSWQVYYELAKYKVTVVEHKPIIPLVYTKVK